MMRYVGFYRMHGDILLIKYHINISTIVGGNSGCVCGLKMVVKRRDIFFIAKVWHCVQNGHKRNNRNPPKATDKNPEKQSKTLPYCNRDQEKTKTYPPISNKYPQEK